MTVATWQGDKLDVHTYFSAIIPFGTEYYVLFIRQRISLLIAWALA